MGLLTVKYNNVLIDPTPFVQQSIKFLDYGNRWGNVLEVQLNGFLSGNNGTGLITGTILNTFTSGQFGKLEVFDGTGLLYSWDTMNIEEVNVNPNNWFVGALIPYVIKMHRHNVPSGVYEPSNEYAFSSNEDGTVNVVHKISARGIKNQVGAFQNAINFVKSLSGRNAFAPVFIASGSGILSSLQETINRVECSYSLIETYKYNTGSIQNYVEYFNCNVSDIIDNEYLSLETNLKIVGSPINKNLSSIESSLASVDSSLIKISNLGFNTGNYMLNTTNVSRDSGAAIIEIKHSYLSGYNINDLSGYFDYRVTFSDDNLVPKETWKLDGRFVCIGPLGYRQQKLANFKSTYGSNWRNYLSGLLVSSPVYTGFRDVSIIPSPHSLVSFNENTGMALFEASFQLFDGTASLNALNPKYSVEVSPNKWIYDLIPSANIEGHYVIQDLQMQSLGHINLSVSADSTNPVSCLNQISGYMSGLQNIYLVSGNTSMENISTGLFSASYEKELIGLDSFASGLLNTKVAGSVVANYTRRNGFRFGY